MQVHVFHEPDDMAPFSSVNRYDRKILDRHAPETGYFVIWKGKVSTLLRQSKGKGCMRLPELSLFSCLHFCSRNSTCCHIQSSNHINEISYHICKVRYPQTTRKELHALKEVPSVALRRPEWRLRHIVTRFFSNVAAMHHARRYSPACESCN